MSLKKLFPPAALLAVSALLSRALGLLRDHLLAKTFGATLGTGLFDLDVYYAAFRVPDLIYNLLVLGTISAAFIPLFTQYKKDGALADAWKFASSMLHLMLVGVGILAGVLYLLAPWLAPLIAGGFSADQLELTVQLMRIMLLSPMLFAIASVLISIQDSFKTFFFRSLAPLFYNVGIIAGVLYWSPENGVIGVTWGVVLGAALQLIVQLPALFQVRYRHYWMLGANRSDVRKAFKLMGPRVVGLSLNQLMLIVNTAIASFLATGSITVFYLADNLQALPLGMIGLSLAITSFATLAELAAEPTPKAFAAEIRRVMNQILFLILPATVGLWVLRYEVIWFLLGHGKFTESDVALTGQVLGLLLISLFAQSLIPLLARGFYAYHDTKTPVLSAALGALVSITASLFLVFAFDWGVEGIALGFTLGTILNFKLLLRFLERLTGETLLSLQKTLKTLILSILMGLVVWILKENLPMSGSVTTQTLILLAYLATGMGVYFGGYRLLSRT
ncbi:murein biosynthesis integral membrane protein MurJ [Candidatus Peregrinibacteria bacterium]|nr:MAG: murein biosynthesis integral membrane protein MurJ [Candidatus Peregrinibacteria bacterium]